MEATLARARAVDAALGVVVVAQPDGGTRIDVADRVTGKRLRRSLPAENAGHERSMIALAVAELVDASLVELRLGATTAMALRVEVDVRPGAYARPQTAWTIAGLLGLHLHRTFGRHVRLGAAMRLMVPVDDLRIRFDERVVQRLGPVWLGAGVTVGTQW